MKRKDTQTSCKLNRQQQQPMRHRSKMRTICRTETDLHWMSRDANTAIGPTVHKHVATQPPLHRHESYNFSPASVSRPSHAIHSAFFIGAAPRLPANRPCQAPTRLVLWSCTPATSKIYLATMFPQLVARPHKSPNWQPHLASLQTHKSFSRVSNNSNTMTH